MENNDQKRIVKNSSLIGIRPLFNNHTESIRRYHDISSFFKDTEDYKVFAEPTVSLSTKDNSIDWQTEFEGVAQCFSDLDEKDREIARGILKRQINNLYHSAYFFTQDMANRKRILAILDNAIEIPDYSNIYLLRDDYNKTNVVLSCWGFIREEFNAPTGLLKDIFPIKVRDISFDIVCKDYTPATNKKIFFNFLGRERELETDSNGKIVLYDLPFDTNIEIYIKDKSGAHTFHKSIMCGKESTYTVILQKEEEVVVPDVMRVSVKDLSGNPVPGEQIIIEIKGKTEKYTSDASGQFVLKKMTEGDQIRCYQQQYDKIFNEQYLVFNTTVTEYEIVLKDSPKEFKPAMLHVVNQKEKPVKKAKAKISFSGKVLKEKTNNQGVIPLLNSCPGDEVEVNVKKGFHKASDNFRIREDVAEYFVKLKTGIPLWFYAILIALILVAGIALYWFFFKTTTYATITVVAEGNNQPIGNAMVLFTSPDGISYKQTKQTGQNGEVTFFSIPLKRTDYYKATVSAVGYNSKEKPIVVNKRSAVRETVKLKVDNAGLLGKSGDIRINLKWFTLDDLDLYVQDPCGNRIYYNKRSASCRGIRGQLDLDANGSTDSRKNKSPQENIYWIRALEGEYKVFVQNNKSRTFRPVKYEVTIKNKNNIKVVKNTAAKRGKLEFVTSFTFRK